MLILLIPLDILDYDMLLSSSDVALRPVGGGVAHVAQTGRLVVPGEAPDVSEVPLAWRAGAGEPGGGRNPVMGQSRAGEVRAGPEISLTWGYQSRLESGVAQ